MRVRDAALLQRLLHHLHDDDRLAPRHGRALELAIPQAPRALVRLPEHAVAPAVRGVLGDRAVDDVDRAAAVLLDDFVLQRAVRRAHHLDLALGALDLDGRAAAVLPVRVGAEPHGRQADAHGLVLGELEDYASRLVGSGVVLVDGGEDLGRLLLRLRLDVVQCLEHPGQGVDAKIEQCAAREVEVDHPAGVGECEQLAVSLVGVDGQIGWMSDNVSSLRCGQHWEEGQRGGEG